MNTTFSPTPQPETHTTFESIEFTAQTLGTCTFLNMTGDITIVWDEANREKILAMIRKKMDEGFVFFTTKKFLFNKLSRRVKVTKKNLKDIGELIIPDEQFDKMVQDMADRDVAELINSESASLAKRKGSKDLTALTRAKTPEEVVDKDSLAVRPIRGG